MSANQLDRLVIDTTNILSLFMAEDYNFFVSLKYIHQCKLYTCPEQIDELRRALHYPKVRKYIAKKPEMVIDYFLDFADIHEIDLRFDRAADLKDNYLFDLAYSVKSYYLVSGDRHVLSLKQVNKIRIISISELKKLLE